jgi:hypothetical protein
MVYRLDDPLDPQGSVFSWEATGLQDLRDADTGKLTQGVQRLELSERLEKCFATGYEINVRPLSVRLTDSMVLALNNFRHEVSGRPYEKSMIELLQAIYGRMFGENKEDLSSLFCSELVAEAYQRMGLLTERFPSNKYVPRDFSAESGLCLELGYSLLSEIAITSL